MLCVIAKLDPTATERLAALAGLSARFGIPPKSVYGHITLATYIGDDDARFIASCKEILSGYGKFSIYYDKIEVWTPPPFIVAVPRTEKTISAIQKEISERWASDLNEWTQEDTWQPHTSLLFDLRADHDAIAEAMREKFQPFAAQVEQIEFSRVLERRYDVIDFVEWS